MILKCLALMVWLAPGSSVIAADPEPATRKTSRHHAGPAMRECRHPLYTVICGYQKGPNEVEVLLPDDYSAAKRYRWYMLPVNTGTNGPWGSSIVEAKKANLQNQYQFIFVAPGLRHDAVVW